jgi:hypothetical protein
LRKRNIKLQVFHFLEKIASGVFFSQIIIHFQLKLSSIRLEKKRNKADFLPIKLILTIKLVQDFVFKTPFNYNHSGADFLDRKTKRSKGKFLKVF